MSGLTDVNILEFLWNYQPMHKHDKIWGYVKVNEKLYCFWGRRGTDVAKSIQFKRDTDLYSLEATGAKKCKKGYTKQDVRKIDGEYPAIDQIYPGFVPHMRNQLMLARLSGTVRKEGN